jgi:uncharacterized membrane protein SpoIIM required for sporulation
MDEREFVEKRQAAWQRLAAMLHKASGGSGLKRLSREELRALGPLYRRAASDLAYARAHAVSGALVSHLNGLVARGFALLYQTDTRGWAGFFRFFTHEFPQTFRRRLPFFLAAVGLLLLGALVGYALVAQSRENIDIFLPPGHPLRESVQYWESGHVSRQVSDAEAATYSSLLMTNNIQVSFLAFALGILGGVFTGYLLFVNGAVVGLMAALMTQVHQHHNFWPGILPHGVVELSETCIAGAAGLSLGWALLAPGLYRRRDALVLAARDAIKLILGGIFLLIFAGLVEGFLSHSLLPKSFKIAFGVVSGIALYAYLFLAGREEGSLNHRGTETPRKHRENHDLNIAVMNANERE